MDAAALPCGELPGEEKDEIGSSIGEEKAEIGSGVPPASAMWLEIWSEIASCGTVLLSPMSVGDAGPARQVAGGSVEA